MSGEMDWEPVYDRGTGVYATKHEPPKFVARFEYTGGGAMRSRAYATRDEAQAHLNETVARQEKFWSDRVEPARTNPNVVVIDGHFYAVGEPRANRECSGFGGRRFLIARHDGTLIETRNLWSGGAIPAAWRERIPNNAEFVNGEHWVQLGGVNYLDGAS